MKFTYLALIGAVTAGVVAPGAAAGATAAETQSLTKCAKAADCTGQTACAYPNFDKIPYNPNAPFKAVFPIVKGFADRYRVNAGVLTFTIIPNGKSAND